MSVPGYWMNETSGVLRPVVVRYLEREELSPAEVATMRAYLRQWVSALPPAPEFVGPTVDRLRADVDGLSTTAEIRAWLELALDAGIDPL